MKAVISAMQNIAKKNQMRPAADRLCRLRKSVRKEEKFKKSQGICGLWGGKSMNWQQNAYPAGGNSGLFPAGSLPNLPYYSAVYRQMQRFAGRYPFVYLSSFGRSVMGKELLYICAGRGSRTVFYSASHHANEWITTLVLLKFMTELFEKSQTGGSVGGFPAASLLENARLCFAPLVNPDGVDLVLGALKSGPSYNYAVRISQDYPQIPFPEGWKANIEGIDLNLQYPANWELAREIKFAQGFVSPAPRDYVGSAPLVAPESNQLAGFTRQLDPSVILALHTQGEVIYWRSRGHFVMPGAAATSRVHCMPQSVTWA